MERGPGGAPGVLDRVPAVTERYWGLKCETGPKTNCNHFYSFSSSVSPTRRAGSTRSRPRGHTPFPPAGCGRHTPGATVTGLQALFSARFCQRRAEQRAAGYLKNPSAPRAVAAAPHQGRVPPGRAGRPEQTRRAAVRGVPWRVGATELEKPWKRIQTLACESLNSGCGPRPARPQDPVSRLGAELGARGSESRGSCRPQGPAPWPPSKPPATERPSAVFDSF